MITNPDSSPLVQALKLRSALQDVSARNSEYSGPTKAGLGSTGTLAVDKPKTETAPTKIRFPVFSEPGVRLIFSIFNRILEPWNWPQTPLVYTLELIALLIIALVVIVFMWLRALSAA